MTHYGVDWMRASPAIYLVQGEIAGAFQDIPQSASHRAEHQRINMVRLMREGESDPATRSQGYKREDTALGIVTDAVPDRPTASERRLMEHADQLDYRLLLYSCAPLSLVNIAEMSETHRLDETTTRQILLRIGELG
ncbi:hypothetical protein GB937_005303 [Aspergillus fischeri]|nr:hypothetical protein GB937_005303 [Aspergillus fischeri]